MNDNKEDKTVILITVDALRPDHLNPYGYYRKTSPNLDKFTKQGTIFLNALANGLETPSSFSNIFTSLLPYLDGGYSPLPSQKITFPENLKENNIFTYGIHSNPHLGRFFNYNRGFDIFLDGERYITREDKPQKLNLKELFSFYVKFFLNYKDFLRKLIYHLKGFNKIKYWLRKKNPILTDILLPFTPMAYNVPYIVNKLTPFLNEFNGSLFLWVHFMDVHSPFNPPSENLLKFRKLDIPLNLRDFYNKEIRLHHKKYKITPKALNDIMDLYDGSINFLDEYLIKLFKVIIQKLKNKCLVIVTADHGESFYEHNTLGHQGNIYNEVYVPPSIPIINNFRLKKFM